MDCSERCGFHYPGFQAIRHNTLEKFLEEVFKEESKYYPGICLQGLRNATKNSVMIAVDLVHVQNEHLRDMS
jgi:hypothetical protein